jgi:hypothetical protein
MAMQTHVHQEALADCPFSIAEEYATMYLHRAERGGTEAVLHVPLCGHGLFRGPSKTVRFSFGIRKDSEEQGRSHDELKLQWIAGSPFLPNFCGTLRFRVAGTGTRIVLDGSYTPPGHSFGRVFDKVLGRRIAAKTCEDLVKRIAADLTDRERAWRRDAPEIAR